MPLACVREVPLELHAHLTLAQAWVCAGQYRLGLKWEELMLGGDNLKLRTCWDSERSLTSPERTVADLIAVEI